MLRSSASVDGSPAIVLLVAKEVAVVSMDGKASDCCTTERVCNTLRPVLMAKLPTTAAAAAPATFSTSMLGYVKYGLMSGVYFVVAMPIERRRRRISIGVG
jgi:hypothetical protein